MQSGLQSGWDWQVACGTLLPSTLRRPLAGRCGHPRPQYLVLVTLIVVLVLAVVLRLVLAWLVALALAWCWARWRWCVRGCLCVLAPRGPQCGTRHKGVLTNRVW